MTSPDWPAYNCCGRKSLHSRGCVNEAQKECDMMRWDGTRQGIQDICTWANEGLDPLEEPFVMYEFTGPA